MKGDFPGGSVVENAPATIGDTGSIPDPRRFPHDTEELSLWATAVEPVLWNPGAEATEPLCPRACAPKQEKPPQ